MPLSTQDYKWAATSKLRVFVEDMVPTVGTPNFRKIGPGCGLGRVHSMRCQWLSLYMVVNKYESIVRET